ARRRRAFPGRRLRSIITVVSSTATSHALPRAPAAAGNDFFDGGNHVIAEWIARGLTHQGIQVWGRLHNALDCLAKRLAGSLRLLKPVVRLQIHRNRLCSHCRPPCMYTYCSYLVVAIQQSLGLRLGHKNALGVGSQVGWPGTVSTGPSSATRAVSPA